MVCSALHKNQQEEPQMTREDFTRLEELFETNSHSMLGIWRIARCPLFYRFRAGSTPCLSTTPV